MWASQGMCNFTKKDSWRTKLAIKEAMEMLVVSGLYLIGIDTDVTQLSSPTGFVSVDMPYEMINSPLGTGRVEWREVKHTPLLHLWNRVWEFSKCCLLKEFFLEEVFEVMCLTYQLLVHVERSEVSLYYEPDTGVSLSKQLSSLSCMSRQDYQRTHDGWWLTTWKQSYQI